ncbi:MAG TPA: DUF4011 domain-containing protein [Phycisphaerales bacterium]|nr:DUF4011 domain-containing protein [Phycisphaerales bacterium]
MDISIECAGKLNLALEQYNVPLVSSVAITNRGDAPVSGLEVAVCLDNGEAAPWSARIERISAGGTYRLTPSDFRLFSQRLAARTEAERTAVTVAVTTPMGAHTKSFPIELLPLDHWPGLGIYPEVVAAFVTPNQPLVAEFLRTARDWLGRATGRDALDGYQSGSRTRASQIAEACFHALQAKQIGYINPPASFELEGQRVRLVDRVCAERLGCCLDLSVLLAGLWEQCGLHPLVVVIEGHAMPALWTHEAHLPEPAIDDAARVRNLIELGEIVVVESTLATEAGSSFSDAARSARDRLRSYKGALCAVDVRAARKRGVRPLPLRGELRAVTDEQAAAATASTATPLDQIELAERAERESKRAESGPPETGAERIKRWRSKLLDLSLRNRLVSFRSTSKTVQIRVANVAALENRLAEGSSLEILPKTDGDDAYVTQALSAKQVHTLEAKSETQSRLVELFRAARSAIEETGANPLYLAVGKLQWFETEASESPRRAPIILLPVTITRSSAGGGYRYWFKLSEEPLRANITLLEKLRTEYGIDTTGLTDLPEDESGIDIALVLRNFRAAIRDMRRWEVEESAHLGLFSFNKFLMWRDLEENVERLKQNRLVSHLVDRSSDAFTDNPLPSADDVDNAAGPGRVYCTRDADSSQLAAVRAAGEGRTFVLEGPPGTGKSQTIANIIADSLAQGKRVLFVAEKMAALSVVHDRLDKDGLGAFCLELHSAKSTKKAVLAQLKTALDAAGTVEPADWEEKCAALARVRDRLNGYVKAIHERRTSGESVYDVAGRLTRLGDGPCVAVPDEMVAHATRERLTRLRQSVGLLRSALTPLGAVHRHPLRGIGRSDWNFGLVHEAKAALQTAHSCAQALRDALDGFLRSAGVEGTSEAMTRQTAEAMVLAAVALQKGGTTSQRLVWGPDAEALTAGLKALCEVGRRRDSERAQLLGRYRDEFLALNHIEHLDAVNSAAARPAIVRFFASRAVRRRLRPYRTDAKPPVLDELRQDLEKARSVKLATDSLSARRDAEKLLGSLWTATPVDWSQVDAVLAWSEQFRRVLKPLAGDPLGEAVAQALAAAAADPPKRQRVTAAAGNVTACWQRWTASWNAVKQLLETSSEQAVGAATVVDWLGTLMVVLRRWEEASGELNDWCAWRRARGEAVSLGLGSLTDGLESGTLAPDGLGDVFERSFGQRWFNAIANAEPVLREFNGTSHNEAIAAFRRLDRELIQATKRVVTARLAARLPRSSNSASPQSELGVLRRELEKKAGHMATRKLVEAMPNLLPCLKPCFLMSPLSVAQYLDAKLPQFDVVIFDEASQIPVWDAIGAIARGKEVIVVGDSKQLPPTSFFDTVAGDDAEVSDTNVPEDMESILKECNASGVPAMWLAWHYRSQHESLIAFSNHFYYENRLHTFPSAYERSREYGVTFHYVENGVYDRGGSCTNRVEAQRVVDELIKLLLEPGQPGSFGIVTFNQAQQTLIEDLLDKRRTENPAIDAFFTTAAEPVFVKNLENVQGDERDTILFSVGYGPDQTGKITMNFGPLNQDGGERRLNVAATRARKRIWVFSSLRAEQIDLRKTKSIGVAHFKTYLDYADRGPAAVCEMTDAAAGDDFDSDFEKAVCAALRAKGLNVDTQVGCAGYRVDLAIKDPDRPGRYVLGVECDGAMYHKARTARDRDRLRQAVLENLGWKLERIWSTDWRVNPEKCLRRVEQAYEAARNATPAAPARSEAKDPEPPPSRSTTFATLAQAPVREQYRCATPPRGLRGIDIADPRAAAQAVNAIRHIVQHEGPIVEDLVIRRLAAWLDARVTEKFRSRVQRLVFDSGVRSVGTVNAVLWTSAAAESAFTGFRVPGPGDDDRRDFEHVPLCERVNAAETIVREQFSLPRDELERQVALLFGVSRVTAAARELAREGVDAAINAGRLIEIEGRVSSAPL